MGLSLTLYTLDGKLIKCKEGRVYELNPGLAHPLLTSLDVLQGTLDILGVALPLPGEAEHFEVDPRLFWASWLSGVKEPGEVIAAAVALQARILLSFKHIHPTLFHPLAYL